MKTHNKPEVPWFLKTWLILLFINEVTYILNKLLETFLLKEMYYIKSWKLVIIEMILNLFILKTIIGILQGKRRDVENFLFIYLISGFIQSYQTPQSIFYDNINYAALAVATKTILAVIITWVLIGIIKKNGKTYWELIK
jgi:hypothetical protein